jgi:hypothetical protein
MSQKAEPKKGKGSGYSLFFWLLILESHPIIRLLLLPG